MGLLYNGFFQKLHESEIHTKCNTQAIFFFISLKGVEEEEYFKKVIEDRKKRYESNEKKRKRREERGTVKVISSMLTELRIPNLCTSVLLNLIVQCWEEP